LHKILLIIFIGNIYEGRKCLLGGTGEIISPSIPNTYNVSNENPSFLVSNGEFFSGNRYSNKSFNNLGGFNNFSNFPGSISASCQNSVINLPLVNNHGNISQINVLGPRIQQLANDIKMDNLSTNNNHIGKSSKIIKHYCVKPEVLKLFFAYYVLQYCYIPLMINNTLLDISILYRVYNFITLFIFHVPPWNLLHLTV